MATRLLPLQQDQLGYANTDMFIELRWLLDGVTPQDLTGWTAALLIGPPRGPALLTLTDTAEGLTLGADGTINVHLSAAETGQLRGGDLAYVLDLTDPGNTVIRFMRGRWTIIHELEAAP